MSFKMMKVKVMMMTKTRAAIPLVFMLLATPGLGQDNAYIKLESNFIGDKEQPSVSYFISWKEIGTPDKLLWDLDSRYDKTLSLVDRQVLRRATSVYKEMNLEFDLSITKDN